MKSQITSATKKTKRQGVARNSIFVIAVTWSL